MMQRFLFGLAAAAALAPLSWAEAQISYSFMEGTFLASKVDTTFGLEEDAIGAGFKGFYEVMSNLHVFGTIQYAEFDDIDLSTTLVTAGVGTHYDFSETKSVFLNVGVLTTEADLNVPGLGSLTGDDDGYVVSVGYREVNHTPLEFRLSIDHIALNDSDTSDTTMDISMQYELSRRWKLLGGIQFGGDENLLRLGARYYLQNDN